MIVGGGAKEIGGKAMAGTMTIACVIREDSLH